jgi:segregation and condensation protein B
MLNDETLKAVIEGIIYVAPEPVSLDAIIKTLEGEERERVKAKLEELVAEYQRNQHGIQIRPVAGGYKFSTKAEHHEVLRKFVKSLKPPIRLSKPALETLAVIAYRQPVTLPEIEEIRGVDCGGVIHTLMEKKLVVTAGRKSVVGRPILYRTSRDFLVHFGLRDVSELPSLKEFEELAKRALGSEWADETAASEGEAVIFLRAPAAAEGTGKAAESGSTEDSAAASTTEASAGMPPEERAAAATDEVAATPPASEGPASRTNEEASDSPPTETVTD